MMEYHWSSSILIFIIILIPTRALHPSLVICALDPKPHAPIWCPCHRGHAFPAAHSNLKQCMCCHHVVLAQSDTKGTSVQHHTHSDLCPPGGIEAVHREDLVDLVLAMDVHHDGLCSAMTEAPGALCFFLIRESASLGSNRCKRTIHLALELLSLTKQFCFKVQQKTNTRVVPYPILIFSAQCPTHLQLDLSIFV